MPTLTCPRADRLLAFRTGQLNRRDLEEVAAHVETCAVCVTVLEGEGADQDALVQELRQAPSRDEFAEETDCRRAVVQAAALPEGDDTADGRTPADAEATSLGKYQLLEKIGQGGMGAVFKAVHTLLKRTVAVKVLAPHRLTDPRAVTRFRREIEAAGRLDHPHIVRTSDADEADGQHFLVMEWLGGQDLYKYVCEQGPLSTARACDFIRQAALGLQCAHEHGMVHRDVKPSNLFRTTDAHGKPIIKVLDLGLALLHDNVDVEKGLTGAGQVMGTFDYIAPEQALESHAVDSRADIYSLGCTLYFLLAGKAPFHGRTEAQKLLAHQLETPPAPPGVSHEVLDVLNKMMAKSPAQRFGSMGDIAKRLERFAGVPSAPETVTKEMPRRRSRRRTILLAALVLFALTAAVFGVIRFTTPEGDYVIDTDDPDFAFSVRKGTIVLEDRNQKRTYNLKVIQKTDDGEWTLEVREPGNDLAMKTDAFTIKRGETVALKAWFERKQADVRIPLAAKPTPHVDPKGKEVPQPTNARSVVFLEITTKLGVQVRVEVVDYRLFEGTTNTYLRSLVSTAAADFWKEAEPHDGGPGRLGLDLGTGLYLLIPVRQVKTIEALDKQHVLTLADGTRQQGKLVTTAVGKDKRSWNLAEVKSATVLAQDFVTPAPTASPKMRLTIPAPHSLDLRLASYQVQSAGLGFGQKIKMTVNGETLTPDLSDFDKVSVSSSKGQWHIGLTPPGGKETAGNWEIRHPSSGFARWSLAGAMRNGWQVLIVYSNVSTTGFTLEKLGARVPPIVGTSAEHSDIVTHLACSRDGSKILTYTSDQVLWLWELDQATFKLAWKTKLQHPMLRGIALDPAGRVTLLALAGSSNLYQADLQTGEVSERRKGRHDGSSGLVFSPDGRRYLVADFYGGVSLRDALEGEVLRQFPGHTAGPGVRPAPQVCFSQDGERILTSGADHTVRLWNSTNAQELNKLPAFASTKKRFIALAPDGKHALVSQDSGVQIWDLTTGKSGASLHGHKDHVTAVAYGPDGAWAVSASQDKTLRIWDLGTGKELASLEGHADDVTCLAVTSDGRIVSASRDKTLRVWAAPK